MRKWLWPFVFYGASLRMFLNLDMSNCLCAHRKIEFDLNAPTIYVSWRGA